MGCKQSPRNVECIQIPTKALNLSDIRLQCDEIYFHGGSVPDAEGYYKKCAVNGSIRLDGHKVRYMFEHICNPSRSSFHCIIRCRLKSHGNEVHWIVLSSADNVLSIDNVHSSQYSESVPQTVKEVSASDIELLYIAKPYLVASQEQPPCFNWKPFQSLGDDNASPPIIIKNEDAFSYEAYFNYKKGLQCSGTDFVDKSIYTAIPEDIHRYSTQHSYYKHLKLAGQVYCAVPMNGGQNRHGMSSPLNRHQLRWHMMSGKTPDSRMQVVADDSDWQWISDIIGRHTFRFNCFLGGTLHGNWSLAIRLNPDAIEYLEGKYPVLKGRFKEYWTPDESQAAYCQMVYDEENMLQIEEAIRCTQRVCLEITKVIVRRRKVADKWAKKEGAPDDIGKRIAAFAEVQWIDIYDEAMASKSQSWRSF